MVHFDNLVKQTDKVCCIKSITQRTHLKKKATKGLRKENSLLINSSVARVVKHCACKYSYDAVTYGESRKESGITLLLLYSAL